VSGLEVVRHAASFRDPAGFVFEQDGRLFRAVHPDAIADVETLFASGLHDELVRDGLLVPHRRVDDGPALAVGWLLLEAERLPLISYACEWTDAQLMAASALTLQVQRRALKHGLTLKDASSFNVQFRGACAIFIDLLSLTRLGPARAWPAYRQFCEHFLAPLALRKHLPTAFTLPLGLDGVALPAASRLLPAQTWLSPGLALHVHLHARAMTGTSERRRPAAGTASTKAAAEFQDRLAASLEQALAGLRPKPRRSAWSDYRQTNVYSESSAATKMRFVRDVVDQTGARRALDLGANDGHYARALVDMGVACTAVEVDAACSEQLYASSVDPRYAALLNTLRVDLTNPTPAHGWAHSERASFAERSHCDLVLALALLHHLSITHQVPFDRIAAYLAQLAPTAVVEFVPTADPMAQRLLAAREGVTDAFLESLSARSFEEAFAPLFDCPGRSEALEGGRVLYHFQRRH
jgi:hypothetical protein